MPIEIEKKYRITPAQHDSVVARLCAIGAEWRGEDFEENTLYEGNAIDGSRGVLRLRRVGKRATLTYKERLSIESHAKHQREDETGVDNPDALQSILEAIGFKPRLVYEKRRHTWHFDKIELVIDQLAFGLFIEIEGSESDILAAEEKLGMREFTVEHSTYPQLTRKLGRQVGSLIEARFES